jgi:hypothetical protein
MASTSPQRKGKKRTHSFTLGERFSGELVYDQADPDALKCLIAANMAGCLIGQKPIKRNRAIAIKTKMVSKSNEGNSNKMLLHLKMKQNSEKDEMEHLGENNCLELTNPFTISWLIHRLSEDEFEKQAATFSNNNGPTRARKISSSSNGQVRSRTYSSSSEYFPFSDIVQAQIMQWNDFSSSEIKPFILGIMRNTQLTPSKATNPKNVKSKKRLSAALDVLNVVLEKKEFLMGSRCTLADIFVAVDLIPIMEFQLAANWPDLKVLQQSCDKKHHVYLRRLFSRVLHMPFAKSLRKKILCYTPPVIENPASLNGKGDVQAKVSQNSVKPVLSSKNQDEGKGEKMNPKVLENKKPPQQ